MPERPAGRPDRQIIAELYIAVGISENDQLSAGIGRGTMNRDQPKDAEPIFEIAIAFVGDWNFALVPRADPRRSADPLQAATSVAHWVCDRAFHLPRSHSRRIPERIVARASRQRGKVRHDNSAQLRSCHRPAPFVVIRRAKSAPLAFRNRASATRTLKRLTTMGSESR